MEILIRAVNVKYIPMAIDDIFKYTRTRMYAIFFAIRAVFT